MSLITVDLRCTCYRINMVQRRLKYTSYVVSKTPRYVRTMKQMMGRIEAQISVENTFYEKFEKGEIENSKLEYEYKTMS